jgi:4-amino-4-deoxy-L-arabinose transferase-like glycosyltransferase
MNPSDPCRDPIPAPASRLRRLQVVAALALFVLVTRLPALLSPKALDDEQVYTVVAREMLHGGKPYIDAIERKPPLLFVVYEWVFRAAGGVNPYALHFTAVLWTLATMGLLYLVARRLAGPEAGVWAALLYGVFLAWGDYRNLAFNGELLMNLPVVGALAITLAPRASKVRPELLLSGALIAAAFLLKQPAGIAGAALGLYLLHPAYRRSRGLALPWAVVQAALLALGFAAALGLAGYCLWREGILSEALRWTLLDHEAPAGVVGRLFLRHAPLGIGYFAVSTVPLLVAATCSLAVGARGHLPWTRHPAEFFALVVLLLVSVVGVAINGQFLFHYFLQLLPALALLAAPVFPAAGTTASRPVCRWAGSPVLRCSVPALALVFLIVGAIGVFNNRSRSAAATYVRDHSSPEDRIFVWGQGDRQTGMYLDAERRPASRFIASFPLTGHVFGMVDSTLEAASKTAPRAWQELLTDFDHHPPAYIIDTDGRRKQPLYPMVRYPLLAEYVARRYRLVHEAPDGAIYRRAPIE